MSFLLMLLTAIVIAVLWRSRAFHAIFAPSEDLSPEAQVASVRLAGAVAFVALGILALWGRLYAQANAHLDFRDPRFDGVTFLQNAPTKALAATALWVVIVAIGVTTWQVLDNMLAKRSAAKADVRLLAAVLISLGVLFGGILR